MKKAILILFGIFFISSSNAQIEYPQNQEKGGWFFTNYFGFAILKVEDSYKTNATLYGGTIAKEFKFSQNYSIIAGVEHLRVRSDIQLAGENAFISQNFLQIPVNVRMNFGEDRTTLYLDLGLYGAYLYNSNVEIISEGIHETEKGLGFNFGLASGFGVSHVVAQNLKFQFGFHSQTDILQSYKEANTKTELSELYALRFGVAILF